MTVATELEYEYIVAPGTDPSVIGMVFAGASALRLNAVGVVFANVSSGLFLKKPRVYQDPGIYKEEIEARYVIEGKRSGSGSANMNQLFR
jgi:hypothetical protein